MQVQTSEQTFFHFLILGNLDFLQKSFITSTTGLISSLDKAFHRLIENIEVALHKVPM